MKLSLIIPAHNEEQHIINTLKVLTNLLYDRYNPKHEYQVVVVDDCSSDDTYLALTKSHFPNLTYYRKVVCQGKGAALKTGCKLIGKDTDIIVFLDADLQIDPNEILTALKLLDLYRADAVVGNKRHKYSNVQYSFFRTIVSNIYSLIIKLLFNLPLRDTQCGLKLFKYRLLPIIDRTLAKQYAFDLELLVALRENHIRVADVPVYVRKGGGTGSVSLYSVLHTLNDTLAVRWRKSIGWYKVIVG